MAPLATALAAGILFGSGLTVSGMVNPQKVLDFLDVAGRWDPSLALVMASALAVTALLFRTILRRPAPLYAPAFQVPTSTRIDGRLIGGSALFGVGWGLGGYCPGPAIASLGYGVSSSLLFVVAMVAGMGLWELRSQMVPVGDVGEPLRAEE